MVAKHAYATAGAFAAWRHAQGLSQLEAGRELGLDIRTVRRYEAGDLPITLTVALACAAVAAGLAAVGESHLAA